MHEVQSPKWWVINCKNFKDGNVRESIKSDGISTKKSHLPHDTVLKLSNGLLRHIKINIGKIMALIIFLGLPSFLQELVSRTGIHENKFYEYSEWFWFCCVYDIMTILNIFITQQTFLYIGRKIAFIQLFSSQITS